MIEAIVDAEIPVMGHLGLTPQSVHAMGGFKVQGREHEAALRAGRRRQGAGRTPAASPSCSRACPTRWPAWSPTPSTCPTIGIGAGPHCDGQVLVFHDVLGIEDRIAPKFVRRYADLKADAVDALAAVRRRRAHRALPRPTTESYHLAGDVAEALGSTGARRRSRLRHRPPVGRVARRGGGRWPCWSLRRLLVDVGCSSAARPAVPRPTRRPGPSRVARRRPSRRPPRPTASGPSRSRSAPPTARTRDALPAGGRHRGPAPAGPDGRHRPRAGGLRRHALRVRRATRPAASG